VEESRKSIPYFWEKFKSPKEKTEELFLATTRRTNGVVYHNGKDARKGNFCSEVLLFLIVMTLMNKIGSRIPAFHDV
jgi:hypothetical protein